MKIIYNKIFNNLSLNIKIEMDAQQNISDEMPLDVKTDLKIAFDFMKSENNAINKLKLRTLIFSFIMYKYSAKDINEYIDAQMSDLGMPADQENFTFDETCALIKGRLEDARERESDELFSYISNKKTYTDKITKKELENIFNNYKLGVEAEDLEKMMNYMVNTDETEPNNDISIEENEEDEEEIKIEKKKKKKKIISVTKDQFKKFYTEKK